MTKEQAINILVRRTFPLMHDDDAREFDRAVAYLRSLPEPSAPVDEEFEQAFAEWRDEYDKHYNYMEISQTGFRIVRNGKVILSVLYE